MILFVCIECGKLFEAPANWKENRGECFGFPTYEELSGCPYCYGNYTEAHRCNCCGEWITGDYIKVEDSNRYCENCFIHMELGDEYEF